MTHPAVVALADTFDSLDDLLDSLEEADWSTQSPCPDWTVAGVVAHLGAIEYMLAGAEPDGFAESLPFDQVAEFMAEVADAAPADLLTRYRELIAQRRAELESYTDEQLDAPSLTPVGPATYGRFMAVRAFDFWVHEQDIRAAVGKPGHEAGPAAELSIDEIEGSLGYIVGKKVGLPDGESITISLTGPVQRDMHVKVDGRATAVPSLDDPTVTLQTDSSTFARLACGRVDPSEVIDAGLITWSGDPQLGEQAARNLAFTM